MKIEAHHRRHEKLESIVQLAGGMAHDFNNLLTVIRTSMVMIERCHRLSRPIDEFTKAIGTAVDRAAELAQRFKDLSQELVFERQTIEINHVIEQAVASIKSTTDSEVHIHLDLSPSPIFVQGDTTRLQQVLANMCLNSQDALSSKPGNIEIKAHTADRGLLGHFAVMSVADDGPGMSPQILSRVFEPFFTTKEPGKGTGLGLPIALSIVEQHGGEIKCWSQPDQGARFDILLPIAHEPAVTPPSKAIRPIAPEFDLP
jgi:signal transduction histidine kinase